jgi:hypothetical protein
MDTDIKIYERPRHAVISVCLAIGCFIVGMQYLSAAETRLMGIVAFLLGIIFLIATIYVVRTPMIILSGDYMMFKAGNFANKEIPYPTIESWSIQNQDKHFFLHLKTDDPESAKEIKEILINYRNVRKADRRILTDNLNKKGIHQNRGK